MDGEVERRGDEGRQGREEGKLCSGSLKVKDATHFGAELSEPSSDLSSSELRWRPPIARLCPCVHRPGDGVHLHVHL